VHIYAFGSICRGDVSIDSDVDLLALVDTNDPRVDAATYSVYTHTQLDALWREGNPFAWHLHLEAKLIFAANSRDYLHELGAPSPYTNCLEDCNKFRDIYDQASREVLRGITSSVFELSTIFLAIRNIATCFSLQMTLRPNFSRHSAMNLGNRSVPIPTDAYRVLERARMLSTRGQGDVILDDEIRLVRDQLDILESWIAGIIKEVREGERIR